MTSPATAKRTTGEAGRAWRCRPNRPKCRAMITGTAVSMLVLSACGATSATAQARAAGVGTDAPSLATPLATSVRASGGTWATVAMGDLGQPLNTFWQLLFRPDGPGSWSDRVEATAVATNGGLVLAGGGGPLIVGVRPSHDLTFSPLIATTDGGRSWSNGLLDQGLASRPGALAGGPSGRALAITDSRGGAEVVQDTGNLSSWQPLVTARALASTASGRACDPGAITSVGYLSSTAVVGTSCRRPGEAGIFVQRGGTWLPTGPALAPRTGPSGFGPAGFGPSGSERAEVLGLVPSGSGLAALIGLSAASSGARVVGTTTRPATNLVAAWASRNGTWRASPAFGLGTGSRLVSFGGTPAGGVFALVDAPRGDMELAIAAGPTSGWHRLPAPPKTTATVALLPGGTVDALAVKNTVLTVWALSPGTTGWVKAQVLNVPVQFGSSS
jgi:hypothetical protein